MKRFSIAALMVLLMAGGALAAWPSGKSEMLQGMYRGNGMEPAMAVCIAHRMEERWPDFHDFMVVLQSAPESADGLRGRSDAFVPILAECVRDRGVR